MDVISRKCAKLQGLKFYFSGIPCKRGGIANRRVGDAMCMCSLCIAHKKEQKKVWVTNNKDRDYATAKKWRESDPIGYAEKQKSYHLSHKISRNEKQRIYTKNNPEKFLAKNAKYRAVKLNATVKWDEEYTKEITEGLYQVCEVLGRSGIKFEVDHTIPLQGELVCGLHVWNNLQILEAGLNSSKNNKFDIDDHLNWL